MLQCELLRPQSPADPLWDDWTQLMSRTDAEQRMFGPDWFRIWAESWGAAGKWTGEQAIIAARDSAGTLQGLLALGRPKVGPFTLYATGGHHVPHRGIVAAAGHETAMGEAIGQFIARQSWPVIQLGPINDSASADAAMIDELKKQNVHLHQQYSYEEISLHAPETFDEYRSEVMNKKFARKVGYYERRMRRAGRVDIKHYRQPTPEEADVMFEALTTIEGASWMTTRALAVPRFTNPGIVQFWKQLTNEYLTPHDHLDCWVMSFEGHPVSFCFTLTDGATRYVIANNYDNAVRDHRTGSTIYWHMVQDGIERGVRQFKFGDGDLHYKSRWGATATDCRHTWLAFPNRLLGCAASAAVRVRSWVKAPATLEEQTGSSPQARETQPATEASRS